MIFTGEAVVLIDGLQRADVCGHQGLAVGAMAVERIGGMNTQQIFQRGCVEVVVSRDSNTLNPLPGPRVTLKTITTSSVLGV